MKNKRNITIILVAIVLIIAIGLLLIFINNKNKKEYYAIPRVYFEGNIEGMQSKEDIRKISVKYESKELSFNSYAEIKVQGTSSLGYEKKNYTINLYSDEEYENKKKIDVGFGTEQSKYCLKANWIDKTHSRNIVTARLAAQIQQKYNLFKDTPNNGLIDGFPVEIYINGEFLGLYTWNIPKDAWLFNMDEDNENHIAFVGEGWTPTNLFEQSAVYGPWEVEVGRGNQEDLDKLNRLVLFVADSDDKTFVKDFSKYLDLDSTINYLIMLEFAGLIDNLGKNMLLVTYDGEIWSPSLYDLDTSWGTDWTGLNTNDYNINDVERSKLWKRMIENYPNEIAERYFELRKDILTKENIMKLFNDFKNSIPQETFNKENNRWSNIPGYDLSQIEEFLDVRIPLIDKLMQDRIEK